MAVVFGLGVGGIGIHSARNLAPPATPQFAKRARASAGNNLRQDNNAAFLYDRGFMYRKRWWFTGTCCPPVQISHQHREDLLASQIENPTTICALGGRTWWVFEDQFYWSSGDYSALDVLALIRERQRNQRAKLDRAHMALRLEREPRRQRRGQLPRELKRAVWERDGGHCSQCGSAFDLQYDHIIPVAMGGATTLENLQLMCSSCNQRKGSTL
jgi:5-methylcytosine-specific restriction endonuclease McrA